MSSRAFGSGGATEGAEAAAAGASACSKASDVVVDLQMGLGHFVEMAISQKPLLLGTSLLGRLLIFRKDFWIH